MKKLTVLILFLALMLGTLASCQTPTNTPTPTGTGTGEAPTESGTNAPAEPETLPAATRQLVEKPLPYTTADECEAWLAERELPNESLTLNLSYEKLFEYGMHSYQRLLLPFRKTALVNNADELVTYIHDCMNADKPESQAAALDLYHQLKDVDFSQKSLLMVSVYPGSCLYLSFQGLALQENALIIAYQSPRTSDVDNREVETWGFVVAVNKADLPANTNELVFCQSVSFPEATDPAMIEYLNLHHGFSVLQSYRFEALP